MSILARVAGCIDETWILRNADWQSRTAKNRSKPGFANPPKLDVARTGWKGDARIAKQCLFFANFTRWAFGVRLRPRTSFAAIYGFRRVRDVSVESAIGNCIRRRAYSTSSILLAGSFRGLHSLRSVAQGATRFQPAGRIGPAPAALR
jgi:hypothetical protein